MTQRPERPGMSDIPAGGLFGQFLFEPDLGKRVAIAREALDGRTARAATSILFAELMVAVDHLRTVLDFVVRETDISTDLLMSKVQERAESRTAEIVDYQFEAIVDHLDDPSDGGDL